MTPEKLLKFGIVPALDELSKQGIPSSVDACRFILAIALQESALAHRRQVGADGSENGAAVSFWQFEQGGGCKGVLTHPAVAKKMIAVCDALNIFATPAGLWEAMRYNDVIAATAARLLVYTLPSGLPQTAEDGWKQYVSAWRPGKPHPERWGVCWAQATAATGAK